MIDFVNYIERSLDGEEENGWVQQREEEWPLLDGTLHACQLCNTKKMMVPVFSLCSSC